MTSPEKAQGKAFATRRTSRIMIVDDHPVVRKGLAEMLEQESDLEICGEAGDVPDAVAMVDDVLPDLMIVDVSLEGGSGLELIKQVKAINSDIKMLVWSMHDESLYAERVLHAGAKGFISKQEPTETICAAIRQVLSGKVWLSPRMTNQMLHRAVGGDADLDQSPVAALTDREIEVFEMIGQGLMTREIAEKLHLSIKTIETHRENIKRKLNLTNSAQLGRYAAQWVIEQSG